MDIMDDRVLRLEVEARISQAQRGELTTESSAHHILMSVQEELERQTKEEEKVTPQENHGLDDLKSEAMEVITHGTMGQISAEAMLKKVNSLIDKACQLGEQKAYDKQMVEQAEGDLATYDVSLEGVLSR